jgi:hypothetical protein
MNLSQNQSGTTLGIDYPPPPRVHWLFLFLLWIAIVATTVLFVPINLWQPVAALAFAPWIMYLCIWLLKLDAKSKCIFWCNLYILLELGRAWLAIQDSSDTVHLLGDLLALVSSILGIAIAFMIRADLLRHYNEREPIGINLSPGLTFFFSFFYLQSQLYPIAQFKKRHAEGHATAVGRTLLP